MIFIDEMTTVFYHNFDFRLHPKGYFSHYCWHMLVCVYIKRVETLSSNMSNFVKIFVWNNEQNGKWKNPENCEKGDWHFFRFQTLMSCVIVYFHESETLSNYSLVMENNDIISSFVSLSILCQISILKID